jgi:pseudouridine kinase
MRRMGLLTEHVVVAGDLPTDRYMAIEAAGGLVAAIADAHSLERVGARILAPLRTGGWGRRRPPTPAPSPLTAT